MGPYSNNSANQPGLLENNPGYGKYIPNSSTIGNNEPSTSGLAPNYNNIFKNNSIVQQQGQQGLVENNPGYGKYITNTSTDKPYNYTNIRSLA